MGGIERVFQRIWSIMGTLMVIQTLLPPPLRHAIDSIFNAASAYLLRHRPRHFLLHIHEDIPRTYRGVNTLYTDVELYLSDRLRHQNNHHSVEALRIHKESDSDIISYTLPPNNTITDSFAQSKELVWTHQVLQSGGGGGGTSDSFRYHSEGGGSSSRFFTLQLPISQRATVLLPYLKHISDTSLRLQRATVQRRLYTNDGGGWDSVDFNHPSTFDTLALPPDTKAMIAADLAAFIAGERFYHDVGRVWKRGYLLYGPPGTGKSSLIAAISNFLHYDIYDLELTSVTTNAELKSLLIRTTRKSVIVIEDVDCSLDLSDRSHRGGDGAALVPPADSAAGPEAPTSLSRVTLSGMLNFTDGLWSTCGEERIFIFTTNHKERLDPALLRPGRMDLHIELSHCSFAAFKILAANYLKLRHHELFPQVEKAMEGCQITPAQVVEVLLGKATDARGALQDVMSAAIESKKKDGEKAVALQDVMSAAIESKKKDGEKAVAAEAGSEKPGKGLRRKVAAALLNVGKRR